MTELCPSVSGQSVPFFFNSRAATALSTPPEIPQTTLRTGLILGGDAAAGVVHLDSIVSMMLTGSTLTS